MACGEGEGEGGGEGEVGMVVVIVEGFVRVGTIQDGNIPRVV